MWRSQIPEDCYILKSSWKLYKTQIKYLILFVSCFKKIMYVCSVQIDDQIYTWPNEWKKKNFIYPKDRVSGFFPHHLASVFVVQYLPKKIISSERYLRNTMILYHTHHWIYRLLKDFKPICLHVSILSESLVNI